jgi:hypothetical protein
MFVSSFLLHGHHGPLILAQVRGCDSNLAQQVPRGFIKFTCVPHHIHVAHMITLPGIHDTPSGDKQFRGDFFQIYGTDTLWFSLAVIHGNLNRVIDNLVPMVRLFMRFNFFRGTITAKTRR